VIAPVFNGSSFRRYVAVILFVAYTLMASWAVVHVSASARRPNLHHAMVFARRVPLVPVLYAAGQFGALVVPVQGVLQSAVTWWFANNLLFLWFGAIALGTAY